MDEAAYISIQMFVIWHCAFNKLTLKDSFLGHIFEERKRDNFDTHRTERRQDRQSKQMIIWEMRDKRNREKEKFSESNKR